MDRVTVRETCLQGLTTWLEGMGDSEDYETSWGLVVRESPAEEEVKQTVRALVIREGEETKEEQFPVVNCFLDLTLDFYVLVDKGEKPSPLLNFVLGELEKRIRSDRTAGTDTIIDLSITGNELEIERVMDKFVSGSLFMDMIYRHSESDPFN